MTETQAKAGSAAADTPGTPSENSSEEPVTSGSQGATGSPGGSSGKSGTGAKEASSSGPAAAGSAAAGKTAADRSADSSSVPGTGGTSTPDDASARSVVGRATVGRASVQGGDKTASASKYSRPPGMSPPPDAPAAYPSGAAAGASSAVGSESAAGAARPGLRGTSQTGTMSLGAAGGKSAPSGTATGAARVTEAVRAARATVSAAAGRGPRRARLHVKRIDPWSVMKFSFAVSFVLFVVVIVATSVLYLALDAMGVFGSVNEALMEMVEATGDDANGLKITAKGIIGGAALVGLVNVVLFTALSTLGAFIYNVCADLVGGVEVTLAEKD